MTPPLHVAPTDVAVCTTHRRFVPCRRDDRCRITSDPEQVAAVRDYQLGARP